MEDISRDKVVRDMPNTDEVAKDVGQARAKKAQSLSDWVGVHIFINPLKGTAKTLKRKRGEMESGDGDNTFNKQVK